MDQPIVFVGGIHGVGKTTVSRALTALLPAGHVTAGTLIRETANAGHRVTTGIGNKAVPNIDANQALLLQGLQLYLARTGPSTVPLLLDGHFSLLNEVGDVVAIPIEVFAALNPVAVVLVEAATTTIRQRLVQRDQEAPSLETLSTLAEHERGCAERVCAELRIPLWRINGDDPTEHAAASAASLLRTHFSGEA